MTQATTYARQLSYARRNEQERVRALVLEQVARQQRKQALLDWLTSFACLFATGAIVLSCFF